jgi:hypothetical protein
VSRWNKTSDKPSEKTLGLPAYPTAVVQNEPDMSGAQRQLQYAKEKFDLTKQATRAIFEPMLIFCSAKIIFASGLPQ